MAVRQIVLDTETTGLDPVQGHRIIEIGCVEMINRRITKNYFHCYINPEREVEEGALAVHGISNAFLADKPVFKAIWQELFAFLDKAELIIHNAPFDIGFLNHEFHLANSQLGKITKYCEVVDTLVLARKLHPGQRNSLDALCKRYNIDNSQRDLHGGLMDANLLARVYLAMTTGQSNLFEDDLDEQTKTAAAMAAGKTSTLYDNLPVIMANEAELQAHQDYLVWLKQQASSASK